MTPRPWIVVLVLASSSPAARADDPLPWRPAEGKPNVTLHPAGKLADGPVVQVAGGPGQTVTTVLEVDRPQVPSHQYVLRGRVKYDGVEDVGFVEMLSTLPGFGSPFTRTLADAGPMGKLTGTSDWRDLELPFYSNPGLLPTKLTVRVVLPGKGTVYLAPLTVGAADPLDGGAAGAWWTDPQGGLVGGLGGALVGLIGALVGGLAGLGVARRFVLGLMVATIAVGAGFLVAGVVAVALGQPYHVYYPLLLIGLLCPLIFGFNLPVVRRRYDQQELRKITALDA